MQITGKMVHVSLSGGFWGIKGDNGQSYCPVNEIPKKFQKEGLRIKAVISPADVMGIFMWGENVKVNHINSL